MLSMWWVVLALAVVTAACYRRSRRRLHQLAREIPSALQEYPIIGHAYWFLGTNEDRMKAWQKFGQIANQQGGFMHFWMANRLFIVMTDANAIEMVSKVCLDKGEFATKFMRTILGNGSIFAPVNIWHQRRKMISPFFNLHNLKHMVKVFHEKSTIMVHLLQSEVGNGDFPLWKYFTNFTFDTIFETSIGVEVNSQAHGHWLADVMDEMASMVSARMLQPWLHPDLVYERLPVCKLFQQHKKRMYDFVQEILTEKQKEVAAITSKGKDSLEANKNHAATFLEMAIQSKGCTDEELCEEAIVFIKAGNDTSAVGSCFAAVLLSRHPDVQDRVYEELEEVFGDSDRPVTPEDLPRLKYMEAVIKETMRLYPPGPVVGREIHNDVKLSSGATLVDGTTVVFNIWGTHRNPEYWGADAGQFRPERFLEGPLPHPAMFIPFSYSVRNCIGAPYAMLLMKTGLANLLRRYRVLPPANMAAADLRAPLAVKFEIMMKAVDNFVVRIEERNKV